MISEVTLSLLFTILLGVVVFALGLQMSYQEGTTRRASQNCFYRPINGVYVNDTTIFGFFNDYSFLSNYCPARTERNGLIFKNSEAAYQSAKYEEDLEKQKIFLNLKGDEARSLTRRLSYDAVSFSKKRLDVMKKVLRSKFSNIALAQALLNTGDKQLVEFNNWGDSFWGQIRDNNGNIVGENNLGKLLMELRTFLKTNK